MRFLSLIVTVCFALVALPAQLEQQQNANPLPALVPAQSVTLEQLPVAVAFSINADLSVLALHDNGITSLSGLSLDHEFCVSFYGTAGEASQFSMTQGPMGQSPVPTVRTQWCDAAGVTHEVVTPIVSQTDAGVARATALHDKLVGIMQAKHPPKKCP